jgi:hypothetical protein
MEDDIVFTKEDIEKYLRPYGYDRSIYQLKGIIDLSRGLKK